MSEVRLHHVTAEHLDLAWDNVKDHLAKVIPYCNGYFDLEDVRIYIEDGVWDLLVIADGAEVLAAFTTETVDHPKKRVLRVPILGGTSMKKWFPFFMSEIEGAAKRIGAQCVEAECRRGWLKALTGFNTSSSKIIVIKEV